MQEPDVFLMQQISWWARWLLVFSALVDCPVFGLGFIIENKVTGKSWYFDGKSLSWSDPNAMSYLEMCS